MERLPAINCLKTMPGLYIHIPFCGRKCSYCAFYSVPANRSQQVSFCRALKKELQTLPADFDPETVFIGGGTPTVLDNLMLKGLLKDLARFHPVEFSVEANPGTVEPEKLTLLRRNGVNRLSLGVQSFDCRNLDILGRIHSAEEAESAFGSARAAGFENISLDLIFGIPGQTLDQVEEDVDRAVSLGPEHLSFYNLMFEEGTRLTERNLPQLDDELERAMYECIRNRLKKAGFVHYEISNFARPGFECRHNRLYWSGGEYIGCGPAAHSHWRGTRRANCADLGGYCRNGPRREFSETLDSMAKAREALVMQLRLLEGADLPADLWEQEKGTLQRLEQIGLLKIAGRHVRLSEEALFVSDAVFAELV